MVCASHHFLGLSTSLIKHIIIVFLFLFLLHCGYEIMEACDTKSSQGFDDASDEGVEVRRGWGAGCSGLRNEFEVTEVEAAAFYDQV